MNYNPIVMEQLKKHLHYLIVSNYFCQIHFTNQCLQDIFPFPRNIALRIFDVLTFVISFWGGAMLVLNGFEAEDTLQSITCFMGSMFVFICTLTMLWLLTRRNELDEYFTTFARLMAELSDERRLVLDRYLVQLLAFPRKSIKLQAAVLFVSTSTMEIKPFIAMVRGERIEIAISSNMLIDYHYKWWLALFLVLIYIFSIAHSLLRLISAMNLINTMVLMQTAHLSFLKEWFDSEWTVLMKHGDYEKTRLFWREWVPQHQTFYRLCELSKKCAQIPVLVNYISLIAGVTTDTTFVMNGENINILDKIMLVTYGIPWLAMSAVHTGLVEQLETQNTHFLDNALHEQVLNKKMYQDYLMIRRRCLKKINYRAILFDVTNENLRELLRIMGSISLTTFEIASARQ